MNSTSTHVPSPASAPAPIPSASPVEHAAPTATAQAQVSDGIDSGDAYALVTQADADKYRASRINDISPYGLIKRGMAMLPAWFGAANATPDPQVAAKIGESVLQPSASTTLFGDAVRFFSAVGGTATLVAVAGAMAYYGYGGLDPLHELPAVARLPGNQLVPFDVLVHQFQNLLQPMFDENQRRLAIGAGNLAYSAAQVGMSYGYAPAWYLYQYTMHALRSVGVSNPLAITTAGGLLATVDRVAELQGRYEAVNLLKDIATEAARVFSFPGSSVLQARAAIAGTRNRRDPDRASSSGNVS